MNRLDDLKFIAVILALLFFSGGFTSATHSAWAQNGNTAPHNDALTGEQFEAQTDLHTASSCCAYLDYSIRLPKGWQKANSEKPIDFETFRPAEPSTRNSERIAKYYAPQTREMRSFVDIQAQELDSPIQLRDLFRRKDLTIMGMNEVSERRLLVLYRWKTKNDSFIVKAVAQMNQNYLVLCSYSVPEIRWNAEKSMQEKVVNSFQLLHPEKSRAFLY